MNTSKAILLIDLRRMNRIVLCNLSEKKNKQNHLEESDTEGDQDDQMKNVKDKKSAGCVAMKNIKPRSTDQSVLHYNDLRTF